MNPGWASFPWLGINPTPSILQNPTWALAAVALNTVWQFPGLSFIIMSGGSSRCPTTCSRPRIDGASHGPFWRITSDALADAVLRVVVGTIYAFQSFGQIDILIGPATRRGSTPTFLIYYIYESLQIDNNAGRRSVLSIVCSSSPSRYTRQMRYLERRVSMPADATALARRAGIRATEAASRRGPAHRRIPSLSYLLLSVGARW